MSPYSPKRFSRIKVPSSSKTTPCVTPYIPSNAATHPLTIPQIHLDLLRPSNKRFTTSLSLFGPITPSSCTSTFYGTKVELLLIKADARSWNMLAKPADGELPPGYTITFGVSGRTGSIGAKEAVLDTNNKVKDA